MEAPSPQTDAPQISSNSAAIQRLPRVRQRTGLGRSTIYREMALGRFPRCVQLTPRAVGWRETDIDAWLDARPTVSH